MEGDRQRERGSEKEGEGWMEKEEGRENDS